MPGLRLLRGHRVRIGLFLLSTLVVFATMYVLYSAIDTLRQLEVIESERDQWQRPAEVLQALDLRPGNVVVDLGSGAGYFALKLSPIVARQNGSHAHEVERSFVEAELRQAGFEILSSQDGFIDRPGDDPWWLTVARKR